jgi:endo-1,4-beta-xylanase
MRPYGLHGLLRTSLTAAWNGASYGALPTAAGVSLSWSLGRLSVRRSFTWILSLVPLERLVQISRHVAALIAPPAPAIGVSGVQGAVPSGLGATLPSGAVSGTVGSELGWAARQQRVVDQHLDDVVLLVIDAPAVISASGRQLGTSLSVRGDRVTLTLAPGRGGASSVHAAIVVSGSAARARAQATHTPAAPTSAARGSATMAAAGVPTPIPVGAAFDWGGASDPPGCGTGSTANGYSGGILDSTGNLQPDFYAYSSTLYTYFDSLTPENEMKMDFLEPCPGQFNFTTADRLVNWALAVGVQVRVNALLWTGSIPGWLSNLVNYPNIPSSVAAAAAVCPGMAPGPQCAGVALHTYVTTIVSHFAGRVSEWDVINEAIDQAACTSTTCPVKDGNGDGDNADVFYEALGPGWVSLPFVWAHAADPNALLFYNEYAADTPGPISTGMLALVKALVANGIPISGVGFEMHETTNSPGNDTLYTSPASNPYYQAMKPFAGLHLKLEVTEADVELQPNAPSYDPRSIPAEQQGDVFYNLARACDWARCSRLTTWGISDARTWKGPNAFPLMFSTTIEPATGRYERKFPFTDVLTALDDGPGL